MCGSSRKATSDVTDRAYDSSLPHDEEVASNSSSPGNLSSSPDGIPTKAKSDDSNCARHKRTLLLVILGSMWIVAGAVVAFVLLSNDNGSHGMTEKDTRNSNRDGKLTGIISAIPNSVFDSPESVQWILRGHVLRDDVAVALGIPANATDEFDRTGGVWPSDVQLSGDGERLAIGGGRGYMLLYFYDYVTHEWDLHTRLVPPFHAKTEPQHNNNNKLFGAHGRFSGDGHHLAVSAGDRMYVYDLSQRWVRHTQPVQKSQAANDDTDSGVAWDYYGDILAVGSHTHDNNNDGRMDVGHVRIFARSPGIGSWRFQGEVKGTTEHDRVGLHVEMSWDGRTLVSGNFLKETKNGIGLLWIWRRASTDTSKWSLLSKLNGPPTIASNGGTHSAFGYQYRLSADGNVLAVSSVKEQARILVYDFLEENDGVTGVLGVIPGTWKQRSHLPFVSQMVENFCLSMDGNFIVYTSRYGASAYQYQSTATGESIWVQVGSFPGPYGDDISCSADGHTVVFGLRSWRAGAAGKRGSTAQVSVWQATT